METRIVSVTKAQELLALLNVVKAKKFKAGPSYNKIEAKGDALLVDPLNGDPFVFVGPATVHIFPSKQGSGTNHLRQRIEADFYFQQFQGPENNHVPMTH